MPGAPELVLIALFAIVFIILPMALMWWFARSRGVSELHAFWGLFSLIGVAAGIIAINLRQRQNRGRDAGGAGRDSA
jgi:hypothetical protein